MSIICNANSIDIICHTNTATAGAAAAIVILLEAVVCAGSLKETLRMGCDSSCIQLFYERAFCTCMYEFDRCNVLLNANESQGTR